jgi:GNAT superfamily N-acetyltransferase
LNAKDAPVVGGYVVARVDAGVVLPLRHAVLRTGRPWTEALFPGDDDPLTAHFAAIASSSPGRGPGAHDGERHEEDGSVLAIGSVLAVGSVLAETPPHERATPDAWRVRGMAVRAESRGRGLGSRLLEHLLAHARRQRAGSVWCRARLPAVGLYERFGFVADGAPERVPGIGRHVTMYLQISERPPDRRR